MKGIVLLLIAVLLAQSATGMYFQRPILGDMYPFCRDPFKHTVSLSPITTPTKAIYLKGNWYEIVRTTTELDPSFICGQLIIYGFDTQFSQKLSMKALFLNNGKSIVSDSTLLPVNVDQTKYISNLFYKKSNLWILEMDPNYQWVVFGEPCRRTFYIYSATPTLETSILQARLENLKKLNFNVDKPFKREDQNCPDILPNTSFIPGNPISAKKIKKDEAIKEKANQRAESDKEIAAQLEARKALLKKLDEERKVKKEEAQSKGIPYIEDPLDAIPSLENNQSELAETKPQQELDLEKQRGEAQLAQEKKKAESKDKLDIERAKISKEAKADAVKQLFQDDGKLSDLIKARDNTGVEIEEARVLRESAVNDVDKMLNNYVQAVTKENEIELILESSQRSQVFIEELRAVTIKTKSNAEVSLELAKASPNTVSQVGIDSANKALTVATETLNLKRKEFDSASANYKKLNDTLALASVDRIVIASQLRMEDLRPKPRPENEDKAYATLKTTFDLKVKAENKASDDIQEFLKEFLAKEADFNRATIVFAASKKTFDEATLAKKEEEEQYKALIQNLNDVLKTATEKYETANTAFVNGYKKVDSEKDALRDANLAISKEDSNMNDGIIKARSLKRRLSNAKITRANLISRIKIEEENIEDSKFIFEYDGIVQEIKDANSILTNALNEQAILIDQSIKAEITYNHSIGDKNSDENIEKYRVAFEQAKSQLPIIDGKVKKVQKAIDDGKIKLTTMKLRYSEIVLKRQVGITNNYSSLQESLDEATANLRELQEQLPQLESSLKLITAENTAAQDKVKSALESLKTLAAAKGKADALVRVKQASFRDLMDKRPYLLSAVIEADIAIQLATNSKNIPQPKYVSSVITTLEPARTAIDAKLTILSGQVEQITTLLNTAREIVFKQEGKVIQERAKLAFKIAQKSSTWSLVSAQVAEVKKALNAYDTALVDLNLRTNNLTAKKREHLEYSIKRKTIIASITVGKVYEETVAARWKSTTTTEADEALNAANLVLKSAQAALSKLDEEVLNANNEITKAEEEARTALSALDVGKNTKQTADNLEITSLTALNEAKLTLAQLKKNIIVAQSRLEERSNLASIPKIDAEITILKDSLVKAKMDSLVSEDATSSNAKIQEIQKQIDEKNSKLNQTTKELVAIKARYQSILMNDEINKLRESTKKSITREIVKADISKIKARVTEYTKSLATTATNSKTANENLAKLEGELKTLAEKTTESNSKYLAALAELKPIEEVNTLRTALNTDIGKISSKQVEIDSLRAQASIYTREKDTYTRLLKNTEQQLQDAQTKLTYYDAYVKVIIQEDEVYEKTQDLRNAEAGLENAKTVKTIDAAKIELESARENLAKANLELSSAKSTAATLYEPIKEATSATIEKTYIEASEAACNIELAKTKDSGVATIIEHYVGEAEKLSQDVQAASVAFDAAQKSLTDALRVSRDDNSVINSLDTQISNNLTVDQDKYSAALLKSMKSKSTVRRQKENLIQKAQVFNLIKERSDKLTEKINEASKSKTASSIEINLRTAEYQSILANINLIKDKELLTLAESVAGTAIDTPEEESTKKSLEDTNKLVSTSQAAVETAKSDEERIKAKFDASETDTLELSLSLAKQKFKVEVKIADLKRSREINIEKIALANRAYIEAKNTASDKGKAITALYTAVYEKKLKLTQSTSTESYVTAIGELNKAKDALNDGKLIVRQSLEQVEDKLDNWNLAKEEGLKIDTEIEKSNADYNAISARIPYDEAKNNLRDVTYKQRTSSRELQEDQAELEKVTNAIELTSADLEKRTAKFLKDKQSLADIKKTITDKQKQIEDANNAITQLNVQKAAAVKENKVNDANTIQASIDTKASDKEKFNKELTKLTEDESVIQNTVDIAIKEGGPIEAKLSGLKTTKQSYIDEITRLTADQKKILDEVKAAVEAKKKASDIYDTKMIEQRRLEIKVISDRIDSVKREVTQLVRIFYRQIKIQAVVALTTQNLKTAEDALTAAKAKISESEKVYIDKLTKMVTAMKTFKSTVLNQANQALQSNSQLDVVFAAIKPAIVSVQQRNEAREVLLNNFVSKYSAEISVNTARRAKEAARAKAPTSDLLSRYLVLLDEIDTKKRELDDVKTEEAKLSTQISTEKQVLSYSVVLKSAEQGSLEVLTKSLSKLELLKTEKTDSYKKAIADTSAAKKELDQYTVKVSESETDTTKSPSDMSKIYTDYREKEVIFTNTQNKVFTFGAQILYIENVITAINKEIKIAQDSITSFDTQIKETTTKITTDTATLKEYRVKTVEEALKAIKLLDVEFKNIEKIASDELLRSRVIYLDTKVGSFYQRLVGDIEKTFTDQETAKAASKFSNVDYQEGYPEVEAKAKIFYLARRDLQSSRLSAKSAKQLLATSPSIADKDAATTASTATFQNKSDANDKALEELETLKSNSIALTIANLRKKIYDLKNSAYVQAVALEEARKDTQIARVNIENKKRYLLNAVIEQKRFIDEKAFFSAMKPQAVQRVASAKTKAESTNKAVSEIKIEYDTADAKSNTDIDALNNAYQTSTSFESITKLEIAYRASSASLQQAGRKLYNAMVANEVAAVEVTDSTQNLEDMNNHLTNDDKLIEAAGKSVEEKLKNINLAYPLLDNKKREHFSNTAQYFSKKWFSIQASKAILFSRLVTGRALANTHLSVIALGPTRLT